MSTVSDSIGRAGQPFGAAPAGGCCLEADRNSRADATHSATKNPFRSTISSGGLHGMPNPAITAIAATNDCASAVANNARVIPRGWKRAMMAPMIPTASTPKYIKLAGLFSDPMIPTAPFTPTRMNAVTSATPTADRYAELSVFFISLLIGVGWGRSISVCSLLHKIQIYKRSRLGSAANATPIVWK